MVTTGSPLSSVFPVAASKTSQRITELFCKSSNTRRKMKIGQNFCQNIRELGALLLFLKLFQGKWRSFKNP